MEPAEKYQRQLLEQTRRLFYDNPLRSATETAYLKTPRHWFVTRYREWGTREWREVREDNLGEHLAMLYADRPLILFGDNDEHVLSTISQPSFVLRMLDMLKLEPGHRVFELGTGSGWNAALIGQLVGPRGHVYSLEIIPEMARRAAGIIQNYHIENVTVIEADGGDGYAPAAPYDRATFTAGTYDLPQPFYQQIRDGGLLLIVLRTEGGGDNLFILRKTGAHFESIDSLPCGFVQMMGRYRIESLDAIYLEALPGWDDLRHRELSRIHFRWGGKGREDFIWRTLGFRSFLGITEPLFQVFKTKTTGRLAYDERYFGLWDARGRSLVIAKDDLLIAYGTPAAKERLMQRLEQWVKLGMPGTISFDLQVYPVGVPLTAGENQWITKRDQSQFFWSLKT
jgi:protein-L-isoaspartate(D-aspartate) O-methyltransferase